MILLCVQLRVCHWLETNLHWSGPYVNLTRLGVLLRLFLNVLFKKKKVQINFLGNIAMGRRRFSHLFEILRFFLCCKYTRWIIVFKYILPQNLKTLPWKLFSISRLRKRYYDTIFEKYRVWGNVLAQWFQIFSVLHTLWWIIKLLLPYTPQVGIHYFTITLRMNVLVLRFFGNFCSHQNMWCCAIAKFN